MTKKLMVLALASLILISPTLAAIKKAPPAEEKAVREVFNKYRDLVIRLKTAKKDEEFSGIFGQIYDIINPAIMKPFEAAHFKALKDAEFRYAFSTTNFFGYDVPIGETPKAMYAELGMRAIKVKGKGTLDVYAAKELENIADFEGGKIAGVSIAKEVPLPLAAKLVPEARKALEKMQAQMKNTARVGYMFKNDENVTYYDCKKDGGRWTLDWSPVPFWTPEEEKEE